MASCHIMPRAGRLALALWLMALLLSACSGTSALMLKTEQIKDLPKDDRSRYTLMYYFGINRYDPRRLIVLDLEDDPYTMHYQLKDYEYEILQGVDVFDAHREAVTFFRSESKITTLNYYKILDPEGKLAGYEIRPLFDKEFLGKADIMDVKYYLLDKKTGKVEVGVEVQSGLKVKY